MSASLMHKVITQEGLFVLLFLKLNFIDKTFLNFKKSNFYSIKEQERTPAALLTL
jgi:hypothetical protein